MTVPIAQRNQRIFLTGFMASGKSTIGPILANAIGFNFADLDSTIAREDGKSVREIFRDLGETYFRRREREVVTAMGLRDRTVISLGGGTLADPETLEIVKTSGILVYLKVTVDEITRRLRNKTDRPMVLGVDGHRLAEGELRERVVSLLAAREPFYSQADITLEADQSRLGLTVDRLVHALAPLIR
jgi:shikimate kinase